MSAKQLIPSKIMQSDEEYGRQDHARIAARIKAEIQLKSIAEETFFDFVMRQSPRSVLSTCIRIVILLGMISFILGSIRNGIAWLLPISVMGVYCVLEVTRAHRRIDALVRLQEMAGQSKGGQEGL